jgi:hypothetical protein
MQISIISTVPELHQVGLPRNLIISYIIYHHFRKVITILNLYFWWWEPNCAWFCFSLYIPDLMQTNKHQANNYIDPKNQQSPYYHVLTVSLPIGHVLLLNISLILPKHMPIDIPKISNPMLYSKLFADLPR